MGRPAKSEHEHFVQGTESKAAKALDSIYEGGRPRIPSHLGPEARSEFKRACKILLERRTATSGDFLALTLYAEVYARWIAAKKELGTQFIVTTAVTDNHGKDHTVDRPNPLIKVVENCESRLLTLAKSLGLTPDARDKVRKTKAKQEEGAPVDPMVAFMSRPRPRPVLNLEKSREELAARQSAKEPDDETL